MSNTQIHLNEVYQILKAIVAYRKHLGENTIYRKVVLRDNFSPFTKQLDPTHKDNTRGFHISKFLEQIAIDLGGNFNYDLGPNGKRTNIRIEF
jgi:hypothetical protein